MIVFITCGAKKRHGVHSAKNLYIGNYFKMNLAYAEHLKADKIYILSAKYGILELDDKIAPYNEALNKFNCYERKLWAYKCYKQLQHKGIDFNEKAVFLGGKNYWRHLAAFFTNREIPFAGIKNGIQYALMKKELQKCTR